MRVKKSIIMMVAALFLLLWIPKQALAAGVVSGSCGGNSQYSYDTGTKVLTISGTGEISDNPWKTYKNDIKKVIINEGITSIKGSAFEGHKVLTSVQLPKSLTSIGFYAFAGCTGIKSITIPKNVTESGGYCFKNSGITTVTFEEGMTEVPHSLFEDCKNLTTIYFPQTMKKIGENAFAGCTGLATVTLPWYLEEIGFYSFANCFNLKKITIYQNVKKINDYAFYNVTGFTICGKKGTTAQTFAKSKKYSFATCKIPALKGITYKKGNLKYTVVTDYINGKGTVCVTGMGKKASSVTIPNKVKLESYNYKVTRINKKAFYKKSALKKVTIKATGITKIGSNAFGKINKKAIIYVPKSKYKQYNKMLKKAGVKSPMKIKKR